MEQGDSTLEYSNSLTYTSLLQSTYDEALENNEVNTNYWKKIKEEYNTLLSHLEILPNELSNAVMVPIGPKALMRGRMVHTNEILVCLGDGWFVKQSAKEAGRICARRIQTCDEMLTKLEKERELLTSRKELPFAEDAFGNPDAQEILEEYDEEKEAEWRMQHREKEREYRQKLAELRKKEKPEVKTEEDLWRKLDDLELQEELEEELDRLHADDSEEEEYEEEAEDSDADDVQNNLQDEVSVCEVLGTNELKKLKLKSKEVSEDCPFSENGSVSNSLSSRRVSFKYDLVEKCDSASESDIEDPLKIEFKHSPCSFVTGKQREKTVIECPADIYNNYISASSTSTAPKSILKKKSSYSNNDVKPLCFQEVSVSVEKVNSSTLIESGAKVQLPEAVHINVVERESTTASVQTTQSQNRPVSMFKDYRTARKIL